MKFILGSGLIGHIAKDIYPEYEFIPFGRSRFYSYFPPLGENYIVANSKIEEYISKFSNILPTTRFFKRGFSIAGEITYADWASDLYIAKLYGNQPIAKKLLAKSVFGIYSGITPTTLFMELSRKYIKDTLSDLNKYGDLNSIDLNNHLIHTSTGTFEYDDIISTIPLDVLLQYTGAKHTLKSRTGYLYMVETSSLDFEGADELLVCDEHFDFYSCTNLDGNEYIFRSFSELNHDYLGAFMKEFKMVNSTKIDGYIPVEKPPDLSWLIDQNILPVGSLARWDDFYDVSTSILTLLNFGRTAKRNMQIDLS